LPQFVAVDDNFRRLLDQPAQIVQGVAVAALGSSRGLALLMEHAQVLFDARHFQQVGRTVPRFGTQTAEQGQCLLITIPGLGWLPLNLEMDAAIVVTPGQLSFGSVVAAGLGDERFEKFAGAVEGFLGVAERTGGGQDGPEIEVNAGDLGR